jgi:hypothetical protein
MVGGSGIGIATVRRRGPLGPASSCSMTTRVKRSRMNREMLSNALFAIACIAGTATAWQLAHPRKSEARGQQPEASDQRVDVGRRGPEAGGQPAAHRGDRVLAAEAPTSQRRRDGKTYVGCLRAENGGKKFVLTDVTGPDAPKARSWKTGFLTKRRAKLQIVAPGLPLRDHVGRLVQVTGRRSDKVLRARALKVVASTCG